MRGVWVTVPVTITGANGASFTTRPIPVLAVTSIDCTETARSCTPRDDPRHVAMIGVGFGRRSRSQSEGTADNNPFLNISGAGTPGLHRGYIVTRDGVQIGVPAAGVPGPYATVQLPRSEETASGRARPPASPSRTTHPPAAAFFSTPVLPTCFLRCRRIRLSDGR
jgi:hypothetical protein